MHPTEPTAFARIATVTVPGAADVLEVVGEIDMVCADLLHVAAVELAERTPPNGVMVVDLSQVTFFGSTGIEALLRAHALLQSRGAILRVVTTPRITTVLTTIGLHTVLELHDTRERTVTE